MSPEQAAGEREIDGRSDLYSLGVVTYQMLTGELPFNAPTVAGILMKQITEPAPDIRRRRPGRARGPGARGEPLPGEGSGEPLAQRGRAAPGAGEPDRGRLPADRHSFRGSGIEPAAARPRRQRCRPDAVPGPDRGAGGRPPRSAPARLAAAVTATVPLARPAADGRDRDRQGPASARHRRAQDRAEGSRASSPAGRRYRSAASGSTSPPGIDRSVVPLPHVRHGHRADAELRHSSGRRVQLARRADPSAGTGRGRDDAGQGHAALPGSCRRPRAEEYRRSAPAIQQVQGDRQAILKLMDRLPASERKMLPEVQQTVDAPLRARHRPGAHAARAWTATWTPRDWRPDRRADRRLSPRAGRSRAGPAARSAGAAAADHRRTCRAAGARWRAISSPACWRCRTCASTCCGSVRPASRRCWAISPRRPSRPRRSPATSTMRSRRQARSARP